MIVTDKGGHHVTGLTRDDFHVFEDGVEQKITAFSAENSGLAGKTSAPDARWGNTRSAKDIAEPVVSQTQQIRQTYLICIDTLHSSQANLMSFRGPLLKFFRGENSADSQYILVALGTSLVVLQDITTDRGQILKAIESSQLQKVFQDSRMAAGNSDLADFRRLLQRVRAACDVRPPAPECSQRSIVRTEATQLASEGRILNTTYFAQFRKLVESLKDAPGRRNIVLISDGFPLVPGKEPIDLLLAYFPEFGRIQLVDSMDRTQELDPILRMASDHNIPIYTIDSRGLYTSPYFDLSASGDPHSRPGPANSSIAVIGALNKLATEAGDTLAEISDATGGTAFRNSNDLLKGLQLAFADGRQYYMLSYASVNANADGKFRAITVRLRDPKMSVKAKRGYWAPSN